jgi:hypothetical protein
MQFHIARGVFENLILDAAELASGLAQPGKPLFEQPAAQNIGPQQERPKHRPAAALADDIGTGRRAIQGPANREIAMLLGLRQTLAPSIVFICPGKS